jgi:tetratricopeptide (TPR) repeat protein
MSAGHPLPAEPRGVAPLEAAAWRATLRPAGLAVAFVLIGTGLVALVWANRLPAWAAALAHLGATAAAVGLAHREPDARSARALWLLAVTFGAIGALGAAGTLLTIALGLHYDRHATPVDEWHRALFPEAEADQDEALWALVGVRRSDHRTTVAPFVDVLQHGSLAQKQAVVALIARHFRPAFAPALRLALVDPQNAVRVQAATAVSLIEAEATSQALDLERQRRERPDDLELLLRIARHEDQYAFTGLLDAAREQDSRARAIGALRAYLAARPEDVAAWHQLGRLFARLGRHEEALSCLREALRHGGSVETRLWAMECLFHLRRFGELRLLARDSAESIAGELQALPVETRQVLRLWVPDPVAAP